MLSITSGGTITSGISGTPNRFLATSILFAATRSRILVVTKSAKLVPNSDGFFSVTFATRSRAVGIYFSYYVNYLGFSSILSNYLGERFEVVNILLTVSAFLLHPRIF